MRALDTRNSLIHLVRWQDVLSPALPQEKLLRSLLNRNQAIGEAKSIPEGDGLENSKDNND